MDIPPDSDVPETPEQGAGDPQDFDALIHDMQSLLLRFQDELSELEENFTNMENMGDMDARNNAITALENSRRHLVEAYDTIAGFELEILEGDDTERG